MALAIEDTTRSRTAETVYWSVAAAMAGAAVLSLILMAFDGRTIGADISIWAKPLKFNLSLAIHAATLAWVTSRLSPAFRSNWLLSIVALAFLGASVMEIGYITYQAAIGEPSHFNMSTTFNRLMWSAMAIAAVVVIAPAAVLGVAAMLDNDVSLAPSARLAVVIGLTGGTLLTLVTAFSIGANMSAFVGSVPVDDSQRMILTGWSLIAGDLRVPHFLSTHMIQIIPVAGIVIARLMISRIGFVVVAAASMLYVAFTLFEYARALDGAPSLLAY